MENDGRRPIIRPAARPPGAGAWCGRGRALLRDAVRGTPPTPYAVNVQPELVVEIAFNDLQASPRYPGGLALRFARVKGYRPDKKPEEADTMDAVRAIYASQSKGETG